MLKIGLIFLFIITIRRWLLKLTAPVKALLSIYLQA